MIATIEPMHGNAVVAYTIPPGGLKWKRTVIDESLNQGHALAIADLLGSGSLQIVAGWRNPDASGRTGIKLYTPAGDGDWKVDLIDDNTIACEDLKVADLDADGKPDIVASGRKSRNVVIYWNRG
jgi:hypothetical protein